MKWTAERIKALRKGYDETQNEFRLRLGVSLTTLKFWETSTSPPLTACLLLDRLQDELKEDRVREPVPA